MLKEKLKKAINVFRWLLTTVLISVVLLLIFTAFNPIKNFQVLRVMSGSMEPAIKVGSVVFVLKVEPENLKKGEIITYTSAEDPKISITHRLTGVENIEGKTVFKTKGDANNTEDIVEVSPSQVKGKVIFSLPLLGYLSVWVRKPLGFGLLIILPAILIIISEILNIKKAIEEEAVKKYKKQDEYKKSKSIESLLVFLLLGIGLFQIKSTGAYFSDVAVIKGTTFSMASEWDPTPSTPGDVVINEIMWGGSSEHELDEWIELRNMTEEDIDLTGWKINGAGPSFHSITLSGTIGTGNNKYYLVSHYATNKSGKAAINDGIHADLVDKDLKLKNIGEQLVLKDSLGNEIDRTPEADGGWVEGEAGPHGPWRSMERDDDPGEGNVADNWHTCINPECNDDTYWDINNGDNYGTPRLENHSEGASSEDPSPETLVEISSEQEERDYETIVSDEGVEEIKKNENTLPDLEQEVTEEENLEVESEKPVNTPEGLE